MDAEPSADVGTAAHREGATVSARSSPSTGDCQQDVKVTLRLPKGAAAALAERAQAAGLARGTYVATVLEGTPAPPYPRDHAACVEALGLSTDGLAVLAKDARSVGLLNHENSPANLIQHLSGSVQVSKALASHLRLASRLLGDLRAEAAQRSRALQSTRRSPES